MTPQANIQNAQPRSNPRHHGATQLRRVGQYLRLTPATPWLGSYLFTVRHTPVDDPVHGMRVEKQPYPLIWDHRMPSGRSYSECFAGLEPLVREVLEAAGYTVVGSGKRPAVLPPSQLVTFENADEIDGPMLDLVRDHDRGLIRYNQEHVQLAALVAQVALAWPKAKVVVTATRVNDARRLAGELNETLGKVGLFTGEHHPARGARVVVATYNRLGDGAIGVERRDICIAVNPSELFAVPNDTGIEGLKKLWRARLYGLLSDETQYAPWQRSFMTALFGMQQVFIPRHGHHDMPVDVVVSRVFGGQRPSDTRDNLVLKRQGIWHHPLRNRRVAALFLALARRNHHELREKFPDVLAYLGGRRWDRVGLLVEGVEHALALAELLPKVPVIAGTDVWGEEYSDAAAQILKRSKERPVELGAIVTSAGLERLKERYDVLIRADGGVGLPVLPELYRAVPNGDDSRLLLVDFKDEHHPVLRKWTRQRRNAYLEVGWNLVGKAAPTLMDRFVADRPEEGR